MSDPAKDSGFHVAGLCSGYGKVPILDALEFSASPGEIVGILGHNGMGKTTLLKTLVGILPVTAGSIKLNGADLTRLPSHERVRRGIGYVAQGREIFAGLTVRENIAFGATAAGRSAGAAVDRAIGDFPILKQLLDRKGGALSGGEQQILALSRTLAGDPLLLLLDEPTEGIAPTIEEEIERHLLRLVRNSALIVVVVEQNVGFLESVAGRVLRMQKGRIIGELPIGDLSEADLFGLLPEGT